MRRILIAVIVVLACATVAEADSFDDALSAVSHEDYALAARLLRPLAEQGHSEAQTLLGSIYDYGQGVPQSDQEAVKWYRKAAEQGDAKGQGNLGVMYDNGWGVPQDFIRAHMWYNVAAAALSGDEGETVMKSRDSVASRMTAAQIEKAQKMARRCQATKFKKCD